MDFRKHQIASARERFRSACHKFVVEQKHRDGDVVKLWRCGKPASSVYSFWICSAPGCLMVYGDMDEYMWQRCPDMIPFVRGSIDSLDYFSEKVPSNIQIREERPELIEEWFDSIYDEWVDEGGEWGDEQDEAFQDIRDAYDAYGMPEHFRTAFYESCLCCGCDDMPETRFYTFQYLWVIEGLKWFIEQLDSGNVKYPQRELVPPSAA